MSTPFPSLARTSPPGARPARYQGVVDDSWAVELFPQGGVLAAVAARALVAELADPSQRLRSLHTTFVAPVPAGPVEVEVELLRRGRSMSHLRAELKAPAAAHGHITTAVFGSPRRGFEFTDLEPPSGFVSLQEAPSFRDPPPPGFDPGAPSPFWERRIEGRGALGHPPWEDYVPDRAENGTWYRLDEPALLEDGTLDPHALIVFADTMPGAVAEKVGPGRRSDWFGPSVDLTFHLFGAPRSEWVLAHNRARFAGDGYASLDVALWDFGADGSDQGRLVAYATQVCFFTFAE